MFTIVVAISLLASQLVNAGSPPQGKGHMIFSPYQRHHRLETAVTRGDSGIDFDSGRGPCDRGYVYFFPDNSCIAIHVKPETWRNARQKCELEGGNLLILDNDHKNMFVTGLMDAKFYWIGARRRNASASSFALVDGREMIYTNWKNGQPDNFLNRERCVMIFGNPKSLKARGFWNDLNCRIKLPYLCEREPPTDEETPYDGTDTTSSNFHVCPRGWKNYQEDKTCLKAYSRRDINVDVLGYGKCPLGRYVTIKDQKKNDFVFGMLAHNEMYFIGLKISEKSNDYEYLDGTKLGSFHPWELESFTVPTQISKCVIMNGLTEYTRPGYWERQNCHLRIGVVCEIRRDMSEMILQGIPF